MSDSAIAALAFVVLQKTLHVKTVKREVSIDYLGAVLITAGVSTLLPFELIGAHVASGRSHTTGRVHDLAFRLAIALFGHAGLEWDLTATSASERADLAQWVAYAKSVRGLMHGGELVRVDRPGDPGPYDVVSRESPAGSPANWHINTASGVVLHGSMGRRR